MSIFDNMTETSDDSQKKSNFTNFSNSATNDKYYNYLNNIENNARSFHEERMKNAPKIVQDYYNGTSQKFQKGLFRALVSTKQNKIIFFVMIMCFAVTFLVGNFSGRGNIGVINGYECELQSFSYDDELFANVKIHPVKKMKKTLEKISKDNQKKDSQELGESFSENKNSFPVKIEFIGESEDGVQMPFEKSVSGEIFLEQNIYRTKTQDYNVKKVYAKIIIGQAEGELETKVSSRLQ